MAMLVVRAALDTEAGVWYVADSDIPGLATEAASFDELCRKILIMVPELLDANGWDGDHDGGTEIPIEIIASRSSRIRRAAA